ncbi:hypothetical protein [Streptomyces sp. NPDC048663]|uniref:hypothetical protein n=1 Tax=Streptomyces sp. NPDC048663 TaxID=3155638 RepID=UPI00342BF032
MAILDADEKSLRARLAYAAEQFKLSPENLQSRVPVEDVLAMAVRSRSNHWVERAVHWMAERDIPREHLELLQELATAKWVNQRTRHIAMRLVKASGWTQG